MRDTTIDSGKEPTQLILGSPGTEQESPFPKYIDRNAFSKFIRFTPEAKAFLLEKLRSFTEQLILNSSAHAEEIGLDIVSAKNVEITLEKFHPAPPSRFRKFAGIFGGILLGAGISALVSMLLASQVTATGSILAFVLSVIGTFLIALDK
jgi:hypothetical protein